MRGRRFRTAGFTVGFPAGFVVVVVDPSLGRVGYNGCSGGRSALALPRSRVDKLALVEVVDETPLGGVGEVPSESFAFLAPIKAAPMGIDCFLKTSTCNSFLSPCSR